MRRPPRPGFPDVYKYIGYYAPDLTPQWLNGNKLLTKGNQMVAAGNDDGEFYRTMGREVCRKVYEELTRRGFKYRVNRHLNVEKVDG